MGGSRTEAGRQAVKSVVEAGRVRACDGLFISINRSWRLAADADEGQTAAFKAMAPIAFEGAEQHDGAAIDAYQVAVAPFEAFWLGFEATQDRAFAVVVVLDGVNALHKVSGEGGALTLDPPNFLLVPDQPWFDRLADRSSTSWQMVPKHADAPAEAYTHVAVVDLAIYAIDPSDLERASAEPSGPVPLYSRPSNHAGAAQQAHLWSARRYAPSAQPDTCARLRFRILSPKVFAEATGKPVPQDLYEQPKGAPPPSHDPFR